jgi:hypothetical protein
MENDYHFCDVSYRLLGEVVDPGNAAAWGFAQVLLILIVYEIWIGEA